MYIIESGFRLSKLGLVLLSDEIAHFIFKLRLNMALMKFYYCGCTIFYDKNV